MALLRDMRDWARLQQFSNRYGYHGVSHPDEVFERAMRLADVVDHYGIIVDRLALGIAAYCHDVDFGLDPRDIWIVENGVHRQAASKEDVSRYLTTQELRRRGCTDRLIKLVDGCIAGTNPLNPLDGVEAQILAAADIQPVGVGTPAEFLANTRKLQRESRALTGKNSTLANFLRGSVNYLGLFTSRRIQLTPRYYSANGRSAWHEGAFRNMLAALETVNAKAPRVIGHVSERPLSLNPGYDDDPENTVLLIIQNNPQGGIRWMRQQLADQARVAPMIAGIPTERSAISVPDGSVDMLHVDGFQRILPEELRRVLRQRQGSGVHVHLSDQAVGSRTGEAMMAHHGFRLVNRDPNGETYALAG
jgi:hypothetical protein